MSHNARLRKVGGSVMVAIPPAFLDSLDLGPDSQVGISIEDGRLCIEPKTGPRYTLDDLLSQCQPDPGSDAEERLWLETPPAGRELP